MWLFINRLLGKKGYPDVTRNEEGQLRADYPYLNKSDFVGAVPPCQSNSAIAGLLSTSSEWIT
jgi:hypothetical protein